MDAEIKRRISGRELTQILPITVRESNSLELARNPHVWSNKWEFFFFLQHSWLFIPKPLHEKSLIIQNKYSTHDDKQCYKSLFFWKCNRNSHFWNFQTSETPNTSEAW
jgi:hypothetical protein